MQLYWTLDTNLDKATPRVLAAQSLGHAVTGGEGRVLAASCRRLVARHAASVAHCHAHRLPRARVTRVTRARVTRLGVGGVAGLLRDVGRLAGEHDGAPLAVGVLAHPGPELREPGDVSDVTDGDGAVSTRQQRLPARPRHGCLGLDTLQPSLLVQNSRAEVY